jgi:hypothetical protein
MPLYLVETISTFRIRYVIDCKEAEHAGDTVVCNEAPEFSQKHIGEDIIGIREITYDEFKHMNENLENGENGSPWMGDKLIHIVDYDK